MVSPATVGISPEDAVGYYGRGGIAVYSPSYTVSGRIIGDSAKIKNQGGTVAMDSAAVTVCPGSRVVDDEAVGEC